MLIDDFMYQGDLIGELNKDASVIMLVYVPLFTFLQAVLKLCWQIM